MFMLATTTAFAQWNGITQHLTATAQYPKYEVRAVWLTTIGGLDWPHSYSNGSAASIEKQKNELITILDQLKQAGINTVLLQTRVRATTIYPSTYEPWDGCLSGNPGYNPGYDALQFAIDECHRRGMQLHAWVVTIPVGKWTSTGCAKLRKQYPNLIKKIGQEGYMDPESPKTGSYLADICEEIIRNYDVDGIHLDYIRYPETWKIKVSRQQGRRNITNIATTISKRVKGIKPWVMMSCSPIGKSDDLSRYSSRGWNARTTVCQDAQEWLRMGVMDALFPMMYFRDNHFYPFAIDWAEQAHGKIVAPGLGTYMLDRHEGNWPLTTITQELQVLRQLGLGHTHFRSKFLTADTKGIITFEQGFNPYPALTPPMTWINDTPPEAPVSLNATTAADGAVMLSWPTPEEKTSIDTQPTGGLHYNVYASRTWPVTVDDARNLVATRLAEPHITFTARSPKPDEMFYAVTAVDRYGNESTPTQSYNPVPDNQSHGEGYKYLFRYYEGAGEGLLYCDGQQLELPEKPATLDANMVCIATMQGKPIATRPYRGRRTDISQLPAGFYQLRSLGRKGTSHRLGFFMIKR